MHQVRYAVCVAVVVASWCSTLPATHQEGDVAWATAKGTLRVAVVGFDRESTAPWEGSTPMLPYIGNIYDPLIAADEAGQLILRGGGGGQTERREQHAGHGKAAGECRLHRAPPGWSGTSPHGILLGSPVKVLGAPDRRRGRSSHDFTQGGGLP